MKYDVQEHLKPRGVTGISDEQIEQRIARLGRAQASPGVRVQ